MCSLKFDLDCINKKLIIYIKNIIIRNNFSISFSKYMELCLYSPSLGYYNNVSSKFGIYGDYITAAEIGSFFSVILSYKISDLLKKIGGGYVLEIGGGSGKLGYNISSLLLNTCSDFWGYRILEKSIFFNFIQKNSVLKFEFDSLFYWIDIFKFGKFNGIIIMNEILDAIPSDLFFFKNKDIYEKRVSLLNNNFIFFDLKKNDFFFDYILSFSNLRNIINDNNKYLSDVNFNFFSFFKVLSFILGKGFIFIFDYGSLENEYYNVKRSNGTIVCYYKNKLNYNPFLHIGLQDITSNVNFDFIIDVAKINDFDIVNYCSFSSFLIEFKINIFTKISEKFFNENLKNIFYQINILTSPSEMGEIFKVLILSKNL